MTLGQALNNFTHATLELSEIPSKKKDIDLKLKRNVQAWGSVSFILLEGANDIHNIYLEKLKLDESEQKMTEKLREAEIFLQEHLKPFGHIGIKFPYGHNGHTYHVVGLTGGKVTLHTQK